MRIEQDIERKFSVAVIREHRVAGQSGGEKLGRDDSIPVREAKNCFGAAQIPLGKQELKKGALKFNYESEKLLRGGSNPVGEMRDCFGAGQIERGRADERCGKRQMRTSEMRTKVEGNKLATALLTIKYDNSPAERIVGPTKKAHLSVSKPKGDSDNKCRLTTNNKDTTNKLVARGWWPRRVVGISATLQLTAQKINPYSLVLPGKRTVTNKLIKQSCAYET